MKSRSGQWNKPQKKLHIIYTALFLYVRTGLRRGELLELPKNKRSKRTIDISKEVVEILKQHRKRQAEIKLLYGPAWEDNDMYSAKKTVNRSIQIQLTVGSRHSSNA